jgi:hypothetical protein
MDMPTPDNQPHTSAADDGGLLSSILVARLLKSLAAAMPADSQADRDENRRATQEMFASLNPRDPAEAQLAAIAIAAAQSAMDGFIRAAQPGVADEAAIRLRGSALVAGRTCAAVLRTLRKRPSEQPAATGKPRTATTPAPAAVAPRPPAAPPEGRDEFQPRDRFGKPIPTFRTELMTRAQLFATLAWPRNPALEAAAVAEEDVMIAKQAALGTGEQATPDAADAGGGTG